MLRKLYLPITFCLGLFIFSVCSKDNHAGLINGHEYVDLGLPSGLKWAKCNVGANTPEEYGDYFAWGEIAPKSEFYEENCKTFYKDITDISGNPKYDVARSHWGGTWRLPTKEEIQELRDNCIWEWTTKNGVNGYLVTGPNGNYIFLPAAGYRNGSSLYHAGSYGCYRNSTPCGPRWACGLYFDSGCRNFAYPSYRYYGRSVRAVSD